ncbi:MAG TPA: Uma2 family endonuclease [Chloroflexota bacterium]|nr:Uma2 family endonuclease [Chloroflexota bacterium]
MLVHDLPTDPQTDMDIVYLRDDTEKDLVGSDPHQESIHTVHQGVKRVGQKRCFPWHVSNQLVVLMGKISSKDWRLSPDIFVHTTAGPEPLTSFNVAAHGVPEFVIEVASQSSREYDLELKRRMYGRVGVHEYLVYDPTSEYLGTQVRAWRATPRDFAPWMPETNGRWHSRVLDLSFRPEGLLLRVFDCDGSLVPTFDEQERRIAELEAKLRSLTP